MNYKQHLATEIEKGFHSMIELLERNKHKIDGKALLRDWGEIKQQYLAVKSLVN